MIVVFDSKLMANVTEEMFGHTTATIALGDT